MCGAGHAFDGDALADLVALAAVEARNPLRIALPPTRIDTWPNMNPN
jgi:hypothetical protein